MQWWELAMGAGMNVRAVFNSKLNFPSPGDCFYVKLALNRTNNKNNVIVKLHEIYKLVKVLFQLRVTQAYLPTQWICGQKPIRVTYLQ